MYIPRETIDLVRNRASIEDIIKKYVPSLKKKGKNYIGLCPFHKEKTPSFTVSPEKHMYHCFGCGESGNVFTFISKIEGFSFPESVRHVARIAGVEIRDDDSRSDTTRVDYSRLNRYAAELYHKALMTDIGKKGFNYITGRGVDSDSIVAFKLGYAPDSWDFLTSRLKQKNVAMINAEHIGLVSQSRKNADHYYDRFRDRVIFPIMSSDSTVIALGGRIIGEGSPKYLNSPESDIFQKRIVLYGLNNAKNAIRQLNRAIVVEGYLDVIGCHQNSIQNVVAPLGTALTEQHIRQLSRYCSEIILLFDSDSAGFRAALRSLDIADEVSVQVRVAVLPQGDPFDYIMLKGPRELMSLVDSALPPVEFRINQIIKQFNGRNTTQIINQLFYIISTIKLESERTIYLKKISAMLKIDENAIRSDYNRFSKKGKIQKFETTFDRETQRQSFLSKRFMELIQLLLEYPHLIQNAVIDFSHARIDDPSIRSLFETMFTLYDRGEHISIDKIFDFFHDGMELEILKKISGNSTVHDNPESVYRDIYINIKLYDIDHKIEEYAGLIKDNSKVNREEYITEIEVLRREKEKLSQYMYNK